MPSIRRMLNKLSNIGRTVSVDYVMNLIGSRRLRVPEIFRAGRRSYLSYRPDWDYDFKSIPEVQDLSQRWVQGNEANNSGDASRLYALVLNLSQVISEGIPGDLAELGVYRGNSAAVMAHYAEKADRSLYLFDTFSGFDPRDFVGIDANAPQAFDATSIDMVKKTIGSDRAIYVPGFFPGTVTPEISDRRFAIAHLDCDLYEPMKAGLEFFYPRLSTGGLMMMHDYSNPHWAGAKQAVDEFCLTIPESVILLPDKSGTAMLRKSKATGERTKRRHLT